MNRIQTYYLVLIGFLFLPQMAYSQHDHEGESKSNKKDTSIIYSWRVTEKLGEQYRVPFDTISLNYQYTSIPEGYSATKGYLGNFGSPLYERDFLKIAETPTFLFNNVYKDFVPTPTNVDFINTNKPLVNALYHTAGSLLNREDRLKMFLTMNANEAFNIGGRIDYVYARGFYANQRVRHLNYQLFSSYKSERYEMHTFLNPYEFQNYENGGVKDDIYILDPNSLEEGKTALTPKDIPTVFGGDVNSKTGGGAYFFTHKYNLGFYEKIDSTKYHADSIPDEKFIPVSSIIHTFQFNNGLKEFNAVELPNGYYKDHFFSTDSTRDKTKFTSIQNTLALSLREGFSKYAKAGLLAYIHTDFRSYSLMDTDTTFKKVNEQAISIGAELSKRSGKVLTYTVNGEIGLIGKESGQVKLTADITTRFPLLGDTLQLNAKGYFKNTLPNFYHRQYSSNHFRWENDFNFEQRTRIFGEVSLKRFNFGINFGIENLTNYIYLDSIGPRQETGSIQVLSASLYKNFKFGILHWDNTVLYQVSSKQEVLPLPTLSAFSNLYIQAKLAKVLSLQLGLDCRYNTAYKAPAYQPALGQFYVQDKIEVGNYPLINVYANLHLKYARFFVMAYNAGKGLVGNNYFSTPHYPISPLVFRIGISVNFYN